jgi:hypothetical protein
MIGFVKFILRFRLNNKRCVLNNKIKNKKERIKRILVHIVENETKLFAKKTIVRA